MNKNIAICVGLWLAEGDNKCDNEITFTNNSLELINFFHKNINNLFKNYNPKIRIYIYNNKNNKIDLSINNVITKNYIDKRARRPYYIWRLASVNINKKWKNIVQKTKYNKKYYTEILKGFCAGEGNIKFGKSHSSRVIRIAQKDQKDFINDILNEFNLYYRFSKIERAYILSGKWNWDKIANKNIFDLHPEKKQMFWKVYNTFKQEHYPKSYLKNIVLEKLNNPKTSKEVSKQLNRSKSRINDILIQLKKEGKIKDYRIKSNTYWTNNLNIVIISTIKKNYLKILEESNKLTCEFSKRLNVNWKASNKRLLELKRLGLIDKDENKYWKLIKNDKEVLVM